MSLVISVLIGSIAAVVVARLGFQYQKWLIESKRETASRMAFEKHEREMERRRIELEETKWAAIRAGAKMGIGEDQVRELIS